jgi:hypothetical protein
VADCLVVQQSRNESRWTRPPTLAGVVPVRALGPEDAFCRLLGGISPLRPDVVLDARKALSRVTVALTDGARRTLAPGRAVLACARTPDRGDNTVAVRARSHQLFSVPARCVPVKVSVSDPVSPSALEVTFGLTYSTRSTLALDCDPPEAVSTSLWPLAPVAVGKLSGVAPNSWVGGIQLALIEPGGGGGDGGDIGHGPPTCWVVVDIHVSPLDVTPTAPEGTASTAPDGSIQYDEVSHVERSAGFDDEAQPGTAPSTVVTVGVVDDPDGGVQEYGSPEAACVQLPPWQSSA